MAKPILPSDPSPTGRRVYAHVERLTAACPGCGAILGPKLPAALGRAYDATTGLWRCPRASCGYTAYVGVVFWPRSPRGAVSRPEDHVLTPGEAASLRLELSYAEAGRAPAATPESGTGRPLGAGRKTGAVNRVCTCGECPIHAPGAPGRVERGF